MEMDTVAPALVATGVVAGAAAIIQAIFGAIRKGGPKLGLAVVETALLSLLGGLLALGFLVSMLSLLGTSGTYTVLLGWAFLFWFGIIDTFAAMVGERSVTEPVVLLAGVATVGALVGACDGVGRVHNWKGLGWLSFPLDVTWGLAATTNGLLFHLVNFAWANRQADGRTGAHRYRSGFRFKGGFAMTQGSVMSNMDGSGPGSGLFRHENTHVWQNRIFGPLFVLTYLGWMVVMFLPALIAGLASKRAGVGQAHHGHLLLQ